jgi:hypothetical protein
MDANDVIAKMMDRLVELEKKDNSDIDMTEDEMDELCDLASAIDLYHEWVEKLLEVPITRKIRTNGDMEEL